MTETALPDVTTRRRLMLRDSLAFASLIAITGVLLAVTLFLFRSFMSHRADLARTWAARGRTALRDHHPEEAITDFRAALSYAPDEREDTLMLAEALAEADHTEEAYNYYRELWEVHPGDGAINLRLARLAAKKRQVQEAINFYRASLYGTWEGDGVERRRAVRLELAAYLIAEHQKSAARAELLVAGGNAPDTPELDLRLAKMLEQADAADDAMSFYRRALAQEPKNMEVLEGAGRLAFTATDYETAEKLLARASQAGDRDMAADSLLGQAERLLQLAPSETLSARERATRILAMRRIAKARLADCAALANDNALQTRWSAAQGTSSRTSLMRDPAKQAEAIRLAYDTELAAAQPSCPPATGDDTALLLLARSAARKEEANHP